MRVVYFSIRLLKVLTLYFPITIVLCNCKFVIGMDNNISFLSNNNNIEQQRLLQLPIWYKSKCIYNETELRNSINSYSLFDPTQKTKIIYQCVPNIVFSNSFTTGKGINLSNKKIDLRCGVTDRSSKCTMNGNGGSRLFYGSTTQFTVTGIDFINGNAPSTYPWGGALLFDNKSILTLNKCSFRNNKAAQWGGAIAMKDASTLVLNGGGGGSFQNPNMFFSNNRAWSGGAIYVEEYSTLSINGFVTFMNNTAFYQDYQADDYDEALLQAGTGGAISLLRSANATMANVSFIGNKADNGGAIRNLFGENIQINIATFTNNTANRTGAISFAFVEWAKMENVSFIENSALINHGGAIDSWCSTIRLQDCVFAKNKQPVNSVGNNIYIPPFEITPGGDSTVYCQKTTFCDVNGLNDTSIYDETTDGVQLSKCKYQGLVQTPGVGNFPA